MLHPGLYEQVINTKLQSELAEIPQARKGTAPIDRAETSRVLSQYLTDIVQKGLDNVLDNGGDIAAQVKLGFDCPLDLHCTYTRDQLLVAMDFWKPATVREGVKRLPEKGLDVFFVTLNKADKDYSPTGQRYIHHRERGSRVLLFVREFKTDRVTGGAGAYTYLGMAGYVKHDGSRLMNITWKLDRPIPAKFLKKTNKLVVG